MPAKSTEKWSEYRTTPRREPSGQIIWTAQRGWHVTGATSDEDARNAVPLDGRPIPDYDESHPENGAMVVTSLPVEPGKGRRSKIVRALYEIPMGTFDGNPFAQPIEVVPNWSMSSESYEKDSTGLIVRNTAGNTFVTPLTRPVADPGWTFIRNEPLFPVAISLSLRYTRNQGNFALPGIGLLNEGQGLLTPITCDGFTLGAGFVRVRYTILAREDGWIDRILDQDTQGWGDDGGGEPKPGIFCNEEGLRLDRPVPLDGTGQPISDKVWVRINPSGAPFPSTTPPETYIPNDDTHIERPGGAGGVSFIRFRPFKLAPWGNLLG